jgi:hypothetical protein
MSINLLVKIRDTINEEIERLTPANLRTDQSYNPEKLNWIRTEGQKGPYERYPAFQQKPQPTADYVNLITDLKNHEGKLVRNGLFYWLWKDETTIGRKPATKR